MKRWQKSVKIQNQEEYSHELYKQVTQLQK
jgi:hypothetical protein